MKKQKDGLKNNGAKNPSGIRRKQKRTAVKNQSEKEIAYQNKDVASKVMGEALVGQSLAPFGLPYIKIVAALPTNLPAIESNELRLDNLFLLEADDTPFDSEGKGK